jgi:FkbM family methyltransferase
MQLPYSARTAGQRLLGNVRVRVRSGINEGLRWSLVSTGRGYGSGAFGRARLEVAEALLEPGDCVVDLGAHKGFMSLAASRLVGPDGHVVAVEPGSTNLWFLRKHVSWNRAGNVRIVRAAVGAEAGTVSFGGRGDSLAYQVGVGDEEVPLMPIPDILREAGAPLPNLIKMDIEGQELAALEGAGEALSDTVALIISIHSRELYDACAALLTRRGFNLFPGWEIRRRISGAVEEWGGDHDLVAIGPKRDFDRARLERLSLFTEP